MDRPQPATNAPIQRLFFRPDQGQAVFGMSKRTLYNLAAAGQIRIYRLGAMSFFKVSEITELLEASQE